MNDLSVRLRKTLNDKSITQEELANMINVSQNAISLIINGKTKKPRNLFEIAQALGVDPVWLKTGEGSPQAVKSDQEFADDENVIRVPVLDVSASAGFGIENCDFVENISYIGYADEHFTQYFNRANADNIRLINVSGDSMAPSFESGDLIFVDTSINTFIGDGVYVFTFNGQLLVKRLQFMGKELLVISDNDYYKPWSISMENEESFRIRAKVLYSQSQTMKKFG
ncbi:Uncharacterized HTH-type transcriptional regulator HI_1476 [Phocoenobacter uteri]|uniref:Uncharacterized HTH-type transcriptional regulator HI_1476 n=1 Tax=Phocoenobacter uteri TaxID=146806 RepID=A0A379CA04_9PAST|nr:helix-turn-helix transcriptional regulator [Phocoenobacter uteri]MDG6881070.1 hypothetical protein [Phocoenobacter uteri]SUB59091.1 Uncharacterized HTH-type transcriptional regulator HI_1476 [Phocoenobacter uteri]